MWRDRAPEESNRKREPVSEPRRNLRGDGRGELKLMKENDERDHHSSTANGALQQATNPTAAKRQVNVAEYGDGDADDKRRRRNRRQTMVLENQKPTKSADSPLRASRGFVCDVLGLPEHGGQGCDKRHSLYPELRRTQPATQGGIVLRRRDRLSELLKVSLWSTSNVNCPVNVRAVFADGKGGNDGRRLASMRS